MTATIHSDHLLLGRILNLLSDAELAAVSTEETADHLLDGDEYVDLGRLDDGVLRAPEHVRPMGRVLVRRAVRDQTWYEILALLRVA